MDSMRGWQSDHDSASDAAVEPPPAVGTDERRMQVRAYNFWAALLGDHAFPAIDDLDIANMGDFGPNCVLLDFTAGIENPAISYLGQRLADDAGLGDDAQYISDVPARSVLSRLTGHYLQIIANRAPIGFEAEFDNADGMTVMYRGILLPFSSDDDTIDFILGVINWKQVAPPAQQAELVDELEGAMAEAQVRSARPGQHPLLVAPAPAWADGPDSGQLEAEAEDAAMPRGLSSGAADGDIGADLDPRPGPDPDGGAPTAAAGGQALLRDVPAPVAADRAEELDDEPLDLTQLADEAELADWLALARTGADRAAQADGRSRDALYQALGMAWDFALAARAVPDALAELIADAGLTVQPRAPLTPLVKLVFGAAYDKSRLAEYSCALAHADARGLASGAFADYLRGYAGGLKALVADQRRAQREDAGRAAPAKGAKANAKLAAVTEQLRLAPPVGVIAVPAETAEGEFTVLIARRLDAGHLGVVGLADIDAALKELVLSRSIAAS